MITLAAKSQRRWARLTRRQLPHARACAPRDQRFGLKAKSFHFTAAHQIAMLQFGNERQF